MAIIQRRIGSSNSGWYGIISSPVNGCNSIIPQLVLGKVYVHLGSILFSLMFFYLVILNYIIPYPFYLIDVYLSILIVVILIGISLILTILLAYPSINKYSILGSTRFIPQSLPSESLFNTITSTLIWMIDNLSNSNLYGYRSLKGIGIVVLS